MTFRHRVLQADAHTATRRYFQEIDGPGSKLALDTKTADLLATELLIEEINPADIVDFHHAVLQLCVS